MNDAELLGSYFNFARDYLKKTNGLQGIKELESILARDGKIEKYDPNCDLDSCNTYPLFMFEDLLQSIGKIYGKSAEKRWISMGRDFCEAKNKFVQKDLEKILESQQIGWSKQHKGGNLYFIVIDETKNSFDLAHKVAVEIKLQNFPYTPACAKFMEGYFFKLFNTIAKMGASVKEEAHSNDEYRYIVNMCIDRAYLKKDI